MAQDSSQEDLLEIQESPEFGRFLVAKRDIPELSLVLRESPLTFGPGDDDEELGELPMCLGCCERIMGEFPRRCSHCGWPICGESCEKLPIHADNECAFFRKHRVSYPPPHTWPIIHKSVLTLRLLLFKLKGGEVWDNVLGRLEHHTEKRYEKGYCVKGDEMLVGNLEYFLSRAPPLPFPARSEVVRISGVISVNAFTAGPSSSSSPNTMIAHCMYRTGSLFANSCRPNCTWRIGPSPAFLLHIRSILPIRRGEALTISYSPQDTWAGTLQRQISTEEAAHFICACERCKDPTELGTLVSAVACGACKEAATVGWLLPPNPLRLESSWICGVEGCSGSQSVQKTVAQLSKVQARFNAICWKGAQTEVEELEDLLQDSSKILHPSHYLLQDVRLRLVKLQMSVLEQLGEGALGALVRRTRALLAIATVLAPGYSQMRSLLQHILARQLWRRTQMQMQNCIGEEEESFQETLQEIEHLEGRALRFFQAHNYLSENDEVIEAIRKRLRAVQEIPKH